MLAEKKGFTILEILVALGIMTLGFLAMSQMQYLSLRQSNLAESGTIATNIIQYASDRDMARVRRLHLLNSRVYLDSQAGKTITSQDDYCNSGVDGICLTCPCDPFQVFTLQSLTDGAVENRCSVIDIENFDPENIDYQDVDDPTQCTDSEFYLVRRVTTAFDNTATPNEINLNVTYAIKNQKQYDEAGFETSEPDFTLNKSLAVQKYRLSAHVDTGWNNFVTIVGNWNQVVVPHIP